MSPAGGWTVCPICGAVVADTWMHVEYHETVLADLIVGIATELIPTTDDGAAETTTQEDTDEHS